MPVPSISGGKAREVKMDNNQPRVGWFCSYTPVELLEAAGVQPVGIREDSGKANEEVVLGDALCSYVRSCFGGALTGVYDDLDGVVIAHSCECMRRLNDGWTEKQEELKPVRIYLLDVPRIINDRSIKFFAGSLLKLKTALEKRYGPIKDKALIEAIEKANWTRDLFQQLYEIRKKNPSIIAGSEIAEITRKVLMMPREEANRQLEKLLADAKQRKDGVSGPRIMVYGGPASNCVIAPIEREGATVVCEHTCTGLRMFSDKVETDVDPLLALARRYLGKVHCPRMVGHHPFESMDDIKG